MYFQQLPDFINSKIFYEFRGLTHPTSVLINNIKNELEEMEEFEDNSQEWYNDALEMKYKQPGHIVDNKLDFATKIHYYQDVISCCGVPRHIICHWDEIKTFSK